MQDPIEQLLEEILIHHRIAYSRPERSRGLNTLDFYLPDFDMYIEVKAHMCERLEKQLEHSGLSSGPVMILIGAEAVRQFGRMLKP